MYAEVVHVLGQFGILQPDMPRLGGGHRDAQSFACLVQVADQLLHVEIAAKDCLIAHHGTFNGGIGLCQGDQRIDFFEIVGLALV